MPFDFAFRSVQSTREIRQTIDFLAKWSLDYPDYQKRWVPKTEAELFSGYKRAALFYFNGILAGDAIWQPHKQLPGVREIKNLRINPQARGRYAGQLLIRQAEVEDKQERGAMMADARETQLDLISMMEYMGYQTIAKLNLYQDDKKDIILFKDFNRNAKLELWIRKKYGLVA